MVIGAVLNTVLDPLFIFVFKMGVQGAAIATIISQAVSAAWVLYYFMAKKSTVKIHAANMKLSWKYVRQIVSMGLAPFSIQLVGSIYNLILNNSLARYGGDKAIAAMGIISSAAMIVMMPVFGINQGTQPIVGYNYGAGKYDRVKKALMYAYIGATSVVILGFLMAMLFPTQIIQFFNRTDGELVSIGVPAMRIFSLLMPVIGFQIVSSNYFQAIGKPKKSMFLTLLRQLIVLIPMVIILPLFFGLNGIWYAVPMSDGISTMLTAVFMYFEMKELNRKITETVKVPAI
jgi:putative MATE family efflux protein